MVRVKWKCPICSGKNSDENEERPVLTCAHCESEAGWEDVLTDEQKDKSDKTL